MRSADPVARDLSYVKRRIDRYLWEDDSAPLEKLRAFLFRHFYDFKNVAIVGGFVRDFARRGRSAFKSDIDLVIDAPAADVMELAARLGAVENRFGGFGFQHPLWKLDFWALETTWAARNGYVQISSVHDITKCTFFDWDASIYEIKDRKVHADKAYLPKLRSRKIDIKLAPTPSIEGNLLRALRRLILWDLEPGPSLAMFIENHLTSERYQEIAETERALFHSRVLSERMSAIEIKALALNPNLRRIRDPLSARQLELPYGS